MKNRFVVGYGVVAFLILFLSVSWFVFSVFTEMGKGAVEAEKGFSWITRTTELAAVTDGFMSDSFIDKLTATCRQSRSLAAITVTTPSGVVFAWPDGSSLIGDDGITADTEHPSTFTRVFSSKLDISDISGSTVLVTSVMYVLHPSTIFAASRVSFLITLALVLVTFIVIIAVTPASQSTAAVSMPRSANHSGDRSDFSILDDSAVETADYTHETDFFPKDTQPQDSDPFTFESTDRAVDVQSSDELPFDADVSIASDGASPCFSQSTDSTPEGLFSPSTGIGWEQYLHDRLEAELVRAASSEQDLALVVLRVSGLLHTDLVSRKIASVLVETFKFRDMVFEFGQDGFAALMQNMNLDQMMKTADGLYAQIDAMLMDMGFDGRIAIGITTRTARLLPAKRMIEEACNAARKAEEEPNLPIVAFRANPEKYRNYIAENC